MDVPILIPNPLYEVVFRYLMDDQRVAKLVLTAILGKEVLDLAFNPIEHSLRLGESPITVARRDFVISYRDTFGQEEKRLVVIQRAKCFQQIVPFPAFDNQSLIPIYILAEPYLENDVPVVRVLQRASYDASTGEKIKEKHPFIEALTHDAIIIQTRYITGKRRTELERFLSIFDQSYISDEKGHKLSLVEATFPDAYRLVVRRLQQALADPKLEAEMDLEDEVLVEFQKRDQEILAIRELAERERKEKENTQRRFVRFLAEQGNDVEAITQATGLEAAVVQRLLAD